MSYALGAGLLDRANDLQLFEFARSVIVRAARLRDRPGRARRPRGRSADRYIELATEVLSSLVSRLLLMPTSEWHCFAS